MQGSKKLEDYIQLGQNANLSLSSGNNITNGFVDD